MNGDQSRSSSAPSNHRSGRSFVSRLASPFASKTRHFTDFVVEPDDPHKTYSPGDTVTGAVRVKVLKAFRVTHITLCLHGFVQVFRHSNRSSDAYQLPHTGRGQRGGEYFGNGYASLFEDEIVLCGEGRLGEAIYKFNFEMDFPKNGLPSSIDFERGTISYMLTASLTRPTTISPVAVCDRKLNFLESIDIAPIPVPKPREVSLKAVSRRSRVKQISRRQTTTSVEQVQQTGSISENKRDSHYSGSQDGSQAPKSPSPSEISFDSFGSSGGRNSHAESTIRSCKTSDSGKAHTNASSTIVKTITATVELLRPGGLRGDNIPLRILINHVKPIQSLHGVIVTLFRQARVDLHPELPLGPMKKGEKEKYEDYYPKSLTGLGGLSLSAAGSSQVFRKDLSQSFTPLIVDPTTLTADIKAAVRIPEEAFPTISGVPGAMISFKYYVEVVLDLQGKLSGQDRFLPSLSMLSHPTNISNAFEGVQGSDGPGSMLAAWGGNIVNTESFRRDKSVVCCVSEVTIGTKDSDRRRGKRPLEAALNGHENARLPGSVDESLPVGDTQEPYPGEQWAADYYGTNYDYGQYQNYHWTHYQDQAYDEYEYPYQYDGGPDQNPPIPNLAEQESQLPEKERLRRAEARLLPSQPPNVDGDSFAHPFPGAPSAPVLPDSYVQWDPGSIEGASLSGSNSHNNARSQDQVSTALDGDIPMSPVPTYSLHIEPYNGVQNATRHQGSSNPSDNQLPPTDDKQELQRRHLQMEASSPGDLPDGADDRDGDAATLRRVPLDYDQPSAPIMDDEPTPEGLPRYER
ncbi:MAG: ph-response sensor protein [Bogoriella megaspora]|nr:MAG: ph-response sensor protein [Bogoriella megaspora]